MCGIAGILSRTPPDAALMERVCGSLAHRGPDGKGIWTGRCNDWNVMLGHRRLSIIDLSDAASQPMASADGSCHIVYNGEIYNYIELREELRGLGFEFRTKSDTEVILAAYRQWGADCLNRFNGMWAFAIHDAKKNILFCARDRFGIKPFYCFRKPGLFVFASEIKALLRHPEAPRVANASRVADFLAFGLVDHSPETFFKDIDRLPPAHYMVIEDGRLSLQPYWVPPKAEPAPETDSAESASRFLELFSDAVRIRLRSDVPVGTCLSGGLDSSSIVCVANRIMFGKDSPIDRDLVGERQKTFTACYGNAEFDERPFVDVVTGQTNASSHRVFPEAAILLKDMDALISHQEEPFGSTSIFAQWCVMRKVKETGVKVLLDGQGGDELLAGYDAYYAALAADRLADFRPIAALAGLKKARRLRGLKAKWLAARTAFFLVPDCLKRPLFPFAKGRLVNCIGADFFRASFTGWPELKRCGSYVQGWSRQHPPGAPALRGPQLNGLFDRGARAVSGLQARRIRSAPADRAEDLRRMDEAGPARGDERHSSRKGAPKDRQERIRDPRGRLVPRGTFHNARGHGQLAQLRVTGLFQRVGGAQGVRRLPARSAGPHQPGTLADRQHRAVDEIVSGQVRT
jgi:asparagine synthase (glutamine-hydrolysing)